MPATYAQVPLSQGGAGIEVAGANEFSPRGADPLSLRTRADLIA
jgi:hypothetical protein